MPVNWKIMRMLENLAVAQGLAFRSGLVVALGVGIVSCAALTMTSLH